MASYCIKCGHQLEEDYIVCPLCGTKVNQESNQYYHGYQGEKKVTINQQEMLWGVLGFFLPLVGLILFLMWQDKKPLIAKYIGIGALIGVFARIIFGVEVFSYIFPFQLFT